MDNIKSLIKAEYVNKTAQQILKSPINVLIGCDENTVEIMKTISINSVFDLATSKIFHAAKNISNVHEGRASIYEKHDLPSSEMIDDAYLDRSILELKRLSLDVLEGIGENNLEVLTAETKLFTIRDFSYWPPLAAAIKILNFAFGTGDATDDPDAPSELIPTARNYATEKNFYQKIFLDEVAFESLPKKQKGRSIDELRIKSISDLVEIDEPIDLGNIDQVPSLYQKPAYGALMTFVQSWYPQGVSLGQLLHSLALAPAESTRIAIIDWARKTSASLTETTSQDELLTQDSNQNRAIEEVTSGVVGEMQSGFSRANMNSTTNSVGASVGFMGIGVNASHSNTSSSANSVSSSKGDRSMTGEMIQNIKNATAQRATSTRSRRASAVKEVRQEENEVIQTRLVTNYNHSHALSVHYYEVIQIYRMTLALEKSERCIFLPMNLIDFYNQKMVEKYRFVLLNSSLDEFTRDILSRTFSGSTWIKNFPHDISDGFSGAELGISSENLRSEGIGITKSESNSGWNIFGNTDLVGVRLFSVINLFLDEVGFIKFSEIEGIAIQRIDGEVFTYTHDDFSMSGELEDRFQYFDLEVSLSAAEIKKVSIIFKPGITSSSNEFKVPVQAIFKTESQTFKLGYSAKISNYQDGQVDLFTVKEPTEFKNVGDVLTKNKLHYSQAIWNALDEQTIAMLLSKYQVNGNPLIEYIDSQPLATYGNYLIFKYHDEGASWDKWKTKHNDFSIVEEEMVPIPTGGVFAEAVLGRFNSSEKLDLSRFWNWQDSPIPHMAPEIAAIQSGSRASTETIQTSDFSSPIVTITNPEPLPSPTGMNNMSNVLAASNLFRDMSGLSGTQGLVQEGASLSNEGAKYAATKATENMKVASDTVIKLAEMENKKPVPVQSGIGASNPSYTGAAINAAKALDAKKINSSSTTPNGYKKEEEAISSSISGYTTPVSPSSSSNSTDTDQILLAANSPVPMDFYKSRWGRHALNIELDDIIANCIPVTKSEFIESNVLGTLFLYFDTAKSSLSNDSILAINEAVNDINRLSQTRPVYIYIYGFASKLGELNYNNALSYERAYVTEEYMRPNLTVQAQIQIKDAKGEGETGDPNTPENDNSQRFRKVEVLILRYDRDEIGQMFFDYEAECLKRELNRVTGEQYWQLNKSYVSHLVTLLQTEKEKADFPFKAIYPEKTINRYLHDLEIEEFPLVSIDSFISNASREAYTAYFRSNPFVPPHTYFGSFIEPPVEPAFPFFGDSFQNAAQMKLWLINNVLPLIESDIENHEFIESSTELKSYVKKIFTDLNYYTTINKL